MLDALEQLRSQAAQLFGIELSERGGRIHSLILAKMLIGVCQTLPLKQTDCSVRPKSLPKQTNHQRLKLFWIEFQQRTVPSTWPDESALVQAACRQPDTQTVVHQHFHAVAAAIGEEISAVRLRRNEHRHHSGQCGFSTGAHVHGLGGQPDAVDADHRSRSLRKAEHAAGFSAGQFTTTTPFE